MEFGQKKNHDLHTIFNKMKGQSTRTFGKKMNNESTSKHENYEASNRIVKPKLEK